MKALAGIILLIASHVTVVAQAPGGVVSPQKRMVTLDLARTLLTTDPIKVDAGMLAYKNPFGPRKPLVSDEPEKATPLNIVGISDREILVNSAGVIAPSGTMMVGVTPILLFGQKKLKVGDTIPIVFQGKAYELELIGIERTSFTLRLNKEELTRPIKSVNKP